MKGATGDSWRKIAVLGIQSAEHIETAINPWSPTRPTETATARAYALTEAIAREDLPIPIVSSSPEGTICFEWRPSPRKLLFFVHSDGLIEFYGSAPSRTSPFEGEIKAQDSLERINTIVSFVFPDS
jgi:hypothetical protein